MLGYLFAVIPFETKSTNLLSIYNEVYLLVLFILLILMNANLFDEYTTKMIGWIMIGFLILSLLCTWIIMLPPVFRSLYEILSSLCKKKSSNNTIEKKITEEEKIVSTDLNDNKSNKNSHRTHTPASGRNSHRSHSPISRNHTTGFTDTGTDISQNIRRAGSRISRITISTSSINNGVKINSDSIPEDAKKKKVKRKKPKG